MATQSLAPSVGRPFLARDGSLSFPNAGGMWGMGAGPPMYVYDATTARRVPAVGRALQLYAGLMKQMPMEAYRGFTRLPQPTLLSRPDPLRGGPEFVGLSVEDYLLSGNTVALVTATGLRRLAPVGHVAARPVGLHPVDRHRRPADLLLPEP